MKKCLLTLLLIISVTGICNAQFSKTHYIPPFSNADGIEPQAQFMYISCPSLTPVNFKIIELGGGIITGTVSRDIPYVHDIGSGFDTQLLINRDDVYTVKNNKGFIVEAEDLVYVTVRLTATPLNYHAGGLVSKGLASLGTQFRIGAFTNNNTPTLNSNYYTFATILATENNTTISFGDIKPGVETVNAESFGSFPPNVVLNRGESFAIAVEGYTVANKDGLIGASITSDKPIAVNCGSFAGSNGTTPNLDLGMDQIVSSERTGTDYIFIRGNGVDETERPLIVANENATDVFINGSGTPYITLNAGEYISFSGGDFSVEGNLYVRSSKKVFAYQGIGGSDSQANQNLHFVPPLSCETPKIINNIPLINEVGSITDFIGTVCIVTETGANLDFIINGVSYTYATLPSGISPNGPLAVTGNPNYVTYTFQGLTGNISVISTKQLYLSFFGSSGAATYGGFYSGFTFKPEISFQPISITQSNCIPNVDLKVNTQTAFDTFQWYYNNTPIPGATTGNYSPTLPGYYFLSAAISSCGTTLVSDEIPVSKCPNNTDGDLANDNVDIDLDNDGISNCAESLGDIGINTSVSTAGTIAIGSYSNTFTGAVTTAGTGSPIGSFTGNTDGSFVTQVPAGKGNSVTYKMNFAQPISVALEYVTTANAANLSNSNADFIVSSPINSTITVLNPNNQLLIDTNYDGNYESGITEYSSFELRFRINSSVPLPAGTGTFSLRSNLTSTFSITQKNLSDTNGNNATFKIIATCVPKDYDTDGTPDYLDSDSDGDGILDNEELTSQSYIPISGVDANGNGMDDAYDIGITPSDFDGDGVVDYYDLDSDNDGIYDLAETSVNTDGTELANYVDYDSDGDGCLDAIEAGFTDPNNDGVLGSSPVIVNANGVVTSAPGYSTPNNNYITGVPISIITQPINQTGCEYGTLSFTIDSIPVDGYQWQISYDTGITWTNLVNNIVYSGTNTIELTINSVATIMSTYKYRVILSKTGNSCGLASAPATLSISGMPVVNDIEIVQCDDNLDAITTFNLTVNNDLISSNAATETFTYYTSFTGAQNDIASQRINNPLAFTNTTPNTMKVWARVKNANNCFEIAEITLKVSATSIPSTFNINIPPVCDDLLDLNGNNTANNDDTDGIATVNFSSATASIQAMLPAGNYTITYYRNQADALSETNAITDAVNYRNIDYPNTQKIWVRIDSDADNACYGLGPFINLTVEAYPKLKDDETEVFCLNKPNTPIVLRAGLISGNPANYQYLWTPNGEITPTISVLNDGNYSVRVTSASGCINNRTITVINSDIAVIENIAIVDFSDNNTVTVNVTGDENAYEYSLDNPNGPFQESNYFENVAIGLHVVYVSDKNGCGNVSKQIGVIGAPKFFTPNGDGYNDLWQIKGLVPNPNTTINIFDQFGKLIKQIRTVNEGWDGSYNGVGMPENDFWFTLNLEDGRIYRGHFSLVR
ncbi:MAG: T9SS type B sorting domain-containing protein [Bacteroidota bacterium]